MAALEKKESSRHGTPEEKSAGSLNVEDGAAARTGQQPSKMVLAWRMGQSPSKRNPKIATQ